MAMVIERYSTEPSFGTTFCEELQHTEWDQTATPAACKLNRTTTKRRAIKRTVSFASSAKTWDGVCSSTENLQTLVWDYWTKNSSIQLLHKLLRERKLDELCTLHDNLQKVVQRLDNLGPGMQTPLIKTGGAKDIVIGRVYRPYIARLLIFTQRGRDRCRQLCSGNNQM